MFPISPIPGGLTRAEIAPLWAFIQAQAGQSHSFDFTAPFQSSLGSMAGTPIVDGADQMGASVNLKGFLPDQSGVLKAGDYLRLAGHHKAYTVTADVGSDATGLASVPLAPALQASPLDGAAVAADGIFRCRLAADAQELVVTDVLHYGFSVDLIEVLD